MKSFGRRPLSVHGGKDAPKGRQTHRSAATDRLHRVLTQARPAHRLAETARGDPRSERRVRNHDLRGWQIRQTLDLHEAQVSFVFRPPIGFLCNRDERACDDRRTLQEVAREAEFASGFVAATDVCFQRFRGRLRARLGLRQEGSRLHSGSVAQSRKARAPPSRSE